MRAIPCLFTLALLTASVAHGKAREVEDTVTLNGKATQRWRGFHANGKRWYVHYWRKGKKVGTHLNYDGEGRKSASVTWRRDVRHGPFTTWHPNGQIATKGQHRDGAEHGIIETFNADGTRIERRAWADTLPTGPYRAWHDNGKPRIEGQFEAGLPVGTWKRFGADGTRIAEQRFEAGQPVAIPGPARTAGGLPDAPDFGLFLITGGAHEGYDFQVWIHPDGVVDLLRLRHVPRVAKATTKGLRKGTFYYDTRGLHRRLRLTDADFVALSNQLQRLGPFDLPEKVINKNVHDGTQWHFGIRAHGKTHRVYCSNDFPPALKRFGKWLRERLMSEDYAFERLTARPDPERTWRRQFDFAF